MRDNEREQRITRVMDRHAERLRLANAITETIAGRRFDGADQSDILAALAIAMQRATRIEIGDGYAAAALSAIDAAAEAGSPYAPAMAAELED